MLTAHRCPNGGTSSPCFCSMERPSTIGCTTKWCRSLAACPSGKLGSTSSPAAPFSHQGLLLNNHHYLSITICCCFWSHQDQCRQLRRRERMERCQGYYQPSPPKNLQGLGPWPRTKQGGEDGNSRSLQTKSSILPKLVNRLRQPSLLIPPVDSLGGSTRLPARHHAMCPNRSCRDVIHYALLPFGDIMFHGWLLHRRSSDRSRLFQRILLQDLPLSHTMKFNVCFRLLFVSELIWTY